MRTGHLRLVARVIEAVVGGDGRVLMYRLGLPFCDPYHVPLRTGSFELVSPDVEAPIAEGRDPRGPLQAMYRQTIRSRHAMSATGS